MIKLYNALETEFKSQGLGVLADATECKVTEERNGQYELSMQYPIRGLHYKDIQYDSIIFCKPNPFSDPQAFQVYKITNGLHGTAHIYAEHISYRLSKITVKPFSADSCQLALAALKTNAVDNCPFEFTTDKVISSPFHLDKPSSIRGCLGGQDDSFLEKYKGEYEFDNFNVILWMNRGQNRGVTIRYGKNLTDFDQERNIQDTYTAIFPYYKGSSEDEEDILVTLPEMIIESSNVGNFPYRKTLAVDLSSQFDEGIPTVEELRTEANRYLNEHNIGVPKVSIKFSFNALRQSVEYEDIAPLERVHLCDTVTVIYPELNVKATAKVIKTVYDVLKDRYTSIEIGDAKSSLAGTIHNNIESVKTTETNVTSAYEKEIARLIGVFSGAYGSNMVTLTDANGKPYELVFMDSDDINTAEKVLRLSAAGILMSSNGYNNANSVWDLQNGTFNGQNINIINLTANNIIGGIIRDKSGRNYWDLDKGEFVLGSIESETQTNSEAIAEINDTLDVYKDSISVEGSAIAIGSGTTIQNGTISTEKIAIAQTFAVGNHVWLSRANGTNTTLVYVGH